MAFKNAKSWDDIPLNEVVYEPELSYTQYTKQDLIDECKGNPYTAEMLYQLLDWQHPSTLLDEWLREGEIDEEFTVPINPKTINMTYKEVLKRKLVFDASGIDDPENYVWGKAGVTNVYYPVRHMPERKEFFWKDKSGRGFTATYSKKELKEFFAHADDRSWDDEQAGEWADSAEVGDTWENSANHITRIK